MMASTLRARDRLDLTPCRNRLKNLRLSTARRRFRKKFFALESVFEMMRFQRKKNSFLQEKRIQVGRVPKNTLRPIHTRGFAPGACFRLILHVSVHTRERFQVRSICPGSLLPNI